MSTKTDRLDRDRLHRAVRELCAVDADLESVVHRFGPPPLWARTPGFATLVRIVLEQQVSLASGAAMYRRLRAAMGRVTAARVAAASPAYLRGLGFTRQKAEYCWTLARRITDGEMNLQAIARSPDADARDALIQVKGIGPWTADIYLLMALRRPDIWPRGDIALAEAARQIKGMRKRPDDDQLAALARRWRPWRSVAARILWHYYLAVRGRG